jgi:hypothetical protein
VSPALLEALVWLGAAMALAGLGGIGWVILEAQRFRRARREGRAEDPDRARRALLRLQAVNMAAVAVAFLGLALVAAGAILG